MSGIGLSSTFGAIYWGFVIATVLLGTSIVQGYFFFVSSKDAFKLKAYVALMLSLVFATTALSSEYLNYYLIIAFGNPLALLYMTKPYITEHVVTTLIVFLTQVFYAWRVYTSPMKKHLWIPILILVLSVISFGAGLAFVCELFVASHFIASSLDRKLQICLSVATSFAAACDIVSTVAFCCFPTPPRPAKKGTRTILSAPLFFAVNCGGLATAVQVCHLVLFLAFLGKIYWVPFHLCLGKLHVNTILAVLNSRVTLRAEAEAANLEINTDFISVTTASPVTPTQRYGPRVNAVGFAGLDSPDEQKRMSIGYHFSRVHEPIAEEDYLDSEADLSVQGRAFVNKLAHREIEPITFA
ncbi:hypothetical protein M0805_000405 [Coniferiporia weirii]|nr:hypothetical protein M0805_000405 [Coniferiporia weirii]